MKRVINVETNPYYLRILIITANLPSPTMAVKDYYKILGLEPGASEQQIRKSFRKLALRHHPDTNQGNKYSADWFREIQEAYAILTNPEKKAAYLQDRWLAKSMGKTFEKPGPLTPEKILAQTRELSEQVDQMDHFRMDYELLAFQLAKVLNTQSIEVLKKYNNSNANRQIICLLLKCAEPVPYPMLISFYGQMQLLINSNDEYTGIIKSSIEHSKRAYWLHKNQWWIFLIITLILCGIVFIAAL